MKTYLTWMPASLIVLTAAFVSPVQKAFTGRTTITKTVEYSVYKGKNYTSEAYKNTSAQVHIIVEKVSASSRSVIWDTTMDAKQLKDFPDVRNAKSERIIVPGLRNKKEHLEITYILTYDSEGSELQMQGGTAVDDRTGKIDISI